MARTGSPSKHDAKDIRMWRWESLAGQVLRLDGQPDEECNEQHHPGADAKDGVPVLHSLAALPNMMPRTLLRMWIRMSLASQLLRLTGQPEEDGHKQHQPSADAKDGLPLWHSLAALPNMMPRTLIRM